jgi:cytochrome b subunit of formate dehydrogenase
MGFFIAIAAIVVALIWHDARKKAEKHETLRRIVESTGTIDEAKLKELFKEASGGEKTPGRSYRVLRIAGMIVMFIGAGIVTFLLVVTGLIFLFWGPDPDFDFDWMFPTYAISGGIAMLGYGLFFASRFAEPPASSRNELQAR